LHKWLSKWLSESIIPKLYFGIVHGKLILDCLLMHFLLCFLHVECVPNLVHLFFELWSRLFSLKPIRWWIWIHYWFRIFWMMWTFLVIDWMLYLDYFLCLVIIKFSITFQRIFVENNDFYLILTSFYFFLIILNDLLIIFLKLLISVKAIQACILCMR